MNAPTPPTSRFWTGFAAVLAAAAGLRALFITGHLRNLPLMRTPDQDAALYDAWARAINAGTPFVEGPFPMAPGYPYLLAALYRVLGTDPVGIVIVHAVFGTATVALAMLLARRLFGTREALVAGVLLLGNGATYFYEAKLLAVSVATTVGVGAVLAAVVAGGRKGAAGWIVAGLLAGVLAMLRANMILLGVVILALLGWRALRGGVRWALPVAYGIGFVAGFSPTAIHNLSHGAALPVAANGGLNLFIGNRVGATGVYLDPPGFSGRISLQAAEADSVVLAETGRALDPAAENRYWARRALGEIASDPLGRAKLLAAKGGLLLNRHEETNNGSYAFEASRVPVLRYAPGVFNLLAALGILGLLAAAGRFGFARSARGSLVAPTAALLAVAATALLFFVTARFRIPAVPVLAVFGAHAVFRGIDAWRAGERRNPALAAALVAVFLVVSWSNPLGSARSWAWEANLLAKAAQKRLDVDDLEGARRIFEQAAELDPENVAVRMELAELTAIRGDFDAALEWIVPAAERRPDDFTIQNNLAILAFNGKRLDLCLAAAGRAHGLDPNSATPLLYRGLALRAKGRHADAGESLAMALDRDPTLGPAYIGLIEAMLNTGRKDRAREAAEAAARHGVELPPEVLRALQ